MTRSFCLQGLIGNLCLNMMAIKYRAGFHMKLVFYEQQCIQLGPYLRTLVLNKDLFRFSDSYVVLYSSEQSLCSVRISYLMHKSTGTGMREEDPQRKVTGHRAVSLHRGCVLVPNIRVVSMNVLIIVKLRITIKNLLRSTSVEQLSMDLKCMSQLPHGLGDVKKTHKQNIKSVRLLLNFVFSFIIITRL